MPHAVVELAHSVSSETYRFRARILSVEGLNDTGLFRFLERPLLPGETTPTAAFDGVCAAADLAEFPLNQALPGSDPPFCRQSEVDVFLRSLTEFNAMRDALLTGLSVLLNTVTTLSRMTETSIVVIGDSGDLSESLS